MSKDTLYGDVGDILDGDTFDLLNVSPSRANDYDYNRTERIRIQGVDAPELPSQQGRRSKAALQRLLGGRRVKVVVHARDTYTRIIGDVSIER